MKKSTIYRAAFYIAGLLILALGIVLNTKSGLGVSPIISISYSVSVIYDLNFGNTTFALYAVFVAGEIILHLIRRPEGSLMITLGKDLLQLPLSLVFTRFMNLFSALLPEPEPELPVRPQEPELLQPVRLRPEPHLRPALLLPRRMLCRLLQH